jgi:hypothetical protein
VHWAVRWTTTRPVEQTRPPAEQRGNGRARGQEAATVGADHFRRHLSTVTLTLYGVGVIVGAGIYVLVGEVVSMARSAAWLSFLCASAAALPTGLSYAELASRYPESAGEAVYADRASGRAFVTALTYLERARDLGLIDLDWIRRRGDFVCGLGRAWRAQRRRSGRPRGVVGPGAHGRLGMWCVLTNDG